MTKIPSLQELQIKLDDTNRGIRNWVVMGKRPELTPEKRELYNQLERSTRAEASLRREAIEYAKSKS